MPRTSRTAAGLALTVALGLTLGACDLRLETPPATERTPSAQEVTRAAAVDDCLAVEQAGRAARAGSAGTAPPVAAVLDDVVAFSSRHVDELGGSYSSGLHPSPTTTPSPTSTSEGNPADVLTALTTSAARALGTADSVPDGGTARLLASIGTSQAQLAARLATALGLPVPSVTPLVAASATSGSPTAVPSPTPSGTTAAAPSGLSPADLDVLTVVQDQAGYGLEVVAAKLDAADRARALAAARAHRSAAQSWAVMAGTATTARDPRRAAYALPSGLEHPDEARALARTLEQAVAVADATMVATAAPGARGPLVADLRGAADAVVSWGPSPVPLPGMPELAPAPTPSATGAAGQTPPTEGPTG